MDDNSNEYIQEAKPCLFEYLNNDKRLYTEPNLFLKSLSDSMSFEYFWGEKLKMWRPHKDVEWRIMPYLTIVYVGDCDPKYFVSTKKFEKKQIHGNSVVILPPGEAFKFELNGTALLGNAHVSFNVLGHIEILSLFNVPYIISGNSAKEIGHIIDELAICNGIMHGDTMDIYSLVKMKYSAFKLLSLIIENSQIQSDKIKKLSSFSRISTVLNFINDNITEDIDRKTLADIMNLSETRFHYVFKDIMGVSPMKYLLDLRLSKAQHLLLTTEDSVSAIAQQVGINDVFYFSKIFKSNYNVSPLHYRELQKNHLSNLML